MGKPSKYTDAEWDAVFEREKAGEARAALAKELGVAVGTLTWQAAKRGIKRGVTPGWPDRRKKPAEGWPEDKVLSQSSSGMTPRRWKELLKRRLAGEADEALAAEYGVTEGRIADQARAHGMRKMDVPEAVIRPRGPATPPSGAGVAFDFRPDDPAAMEASLRALAEAAAAEGRAADFLTLRRLRKAAAEWVGNGGAAGGPLPLACGDVAGRSYTTGQAPPEGEELESLELRPSQRAPEGAWSTWLFLGGRGAGKTLAGASWLADQAEALGAGGRLAMIGPTLHDVREVMVEGASGVLALPRWAGGARPVFEPSRRRLVFPNGAVAQAFSAEDPDSLRGPQFAAAWADEFCAWRNGGEVLALLRMGLRLPGPPSTPFPLEREGEGRRAPRLCITTTPRPTAALRRLRGEPGCVQTHAATKDNAAHLSAGFVEGLERLYGGTKKAAQELEGKVVEAEGALFTAEMMMRARVAPVLPSSSGLTRGSEAAGGAQPAEASPGERLALGSSPRVTFERVVVGLDPTTTTGGNACGIVVAGRVGERAVVLADWSMSGLSPDGWARRAVRAAEAFGAQAIVAEVNQGGEMVRAVLKAAGCAVRLREVRATKGKRVRAEPVAALYEQGRVTHAGAFDALEEELMALGSDELEAGCGLDRADALVWALTDLLLDRAGAREGPRISWLDGPVRTGLSVR